MALQSDIFAISEEGADVYGRRIKPHVAFVLSVMLDVILSYLFFKLVLSQNFAHFELSHRKLFFTAERGQIKLIENLIDLVNILILAC